MHKILLTAATALAIGLPAAAHAQQANILVVDSDRLMSECSACKSANTQLQAKQATLKSRAQTLQTQLAAERKPIQDAVDALNGKEPDAALKARITAWQTKERNANQELETSTGSLQSTVAHVQQQIGQKIVAIVEATRARRGAAIVLSKNSTIANDTAIDVTGEVLSTLNSQLPAVSITPMPQSAAQQTPQGR